MTIEKYDARSHMTFLTVLVFGPESVSYERSRRENCAKFHEMLARVFFEKKSENQDSMRYCILVFFWILFLKIASFPMLFSHPTRPPGRPAARPSVRLGSKLNQDDLSSSIFMFKTESK